MMAMVSPPTTARSSPMIHADHWVRLDGHAHQRCDTAVSNGEVANDLRLNKERNVGLEGEVQGKAVKTTLPKDSQPASWVAQAHQLRALLAGAGCGGP